MPDSKHIEAAWRIWKAEVGRHHVPNLSVTQMAAIIAEVMAEPPKSGRFSICSAHQIPDPQCPRCNVKLPA